MASVSTKRFGGRRAVRNMTTVVVRDDTGRLDAVWFNAPYRADSAKKGDTVVVSGKVREYKTVQMIAPSIEVVGEGPAENFAEWSLPVLPFYRLPAGLYQRSMRKAVAAALDIAGGAIEDVFDEKFLRARDLPPLARAYRDAHLPENIESARAARRRFAYDELFFIETAIALRRGAVKRSAKNFRAHVTEAVDKRIRARMPFQLTEGQERVIAEITADIQATAPMNRLLQGDVGSGKTVVALYAMLAYVANGIQAAFMAPTEILAEQHQRTISEFLRGSRVRVALLKGRQKALERQQALDDLAAGKTDIVVGTHALIQKDIAFAKLGIIVVDEQHKFGVLQRGALKRKGLNPDVLVMTATPIPRTLAMTVFGDLDVSVIEGLPPGRVPVETRLVPPKNIGKAYEFIREELKAGRQAYFVYPLIEESQKEGMAGLKAATQTRDELAEKVFPEFRVALLHGGMRPDEKDRIMAEFRDGAINVLVATVVIEVGIDVPNATVMVVENAERFGLSQLHQLRGRIGRGSAKSYCLLLGDAGTEAARERLEALAATSDGFRIAEEDLRLRGPGELLGTRQHGLPDLVHADLAQDFELLCRARDDAFGMVERRELQAGRAKIKLDEAAYENLIGEMRRRIKKRIELMATA